MSPAAGSGWRYAVLRRMRVLAPLCALGLLLPALLALLPAESAGTLVWLLDLGANWQWLFVAATAISAGLATLVDRRWALLLPMLPLPWLTASALLPPARAAAPALTIVSANVHMDNQDVAPLARWLAQEKPDLVVVLEVAPIYAQGLMALGAYPYRHIVPQDSPFGIAVLSRHPLSGARTVQDADGIPHIDALLEWQGRQIRLIAVHPMPPISAAFAASRDRQLAAWAKSAGRQPTLLAGDLNATTWSSAFNGLDALGLRRATGLAPTWPTALRALSGIPIDHVLASHHWKRVDSSRGPDLGSDHAPVLARVAFGQP